MKKLLLSLLLIVVSLQGFESVPPNLGASYLDAVARGDYGGKRSFNIEGLSENITVGTRDVSELGVDTIPTPDINGTLMDIVSTSALDTVVGTGSRIIKIDYIDPTDLKLKYVLVNLNGTTPVQVPVSIAFVSDVTSVENGLISGEVSTAQGDITLYLRGTPATEYNIIKAGGNKSLTAYRFIPDNTCLFISGWTASGDTKGVKVKLRATQTDDFFKTNGFIFRDVIIVGETAVPQIFTVPIKLQGNVKVKASVFVGTGLGGGDIATSIHGWLETNCQ